MPSLRRRQIAGETPVDRPAEVTSGIASVLSLAPLYRLAQSAIGATRFQHEVTTTLLNVSSGDRVLDVGCGPADILAALPADIVYTGFDLNDRYVVAARERFGSRGRFVSAPVESAPFADEHFDVVMCIGVLHHLDDASVREVIDLALSVLPPGGRFFSIDPTFVDGQRRIARFLAARDRGQHVRTPASLSALFDGAFATMEIGVRDDLLRIPYNHATVSATAH